MASGLLVGVGLAAAPAHGQGYGGTVSDMLVRGDSLLAQKRPNEAIVQFQEVRTLCPTPAETVSSLLGEARGRLSLGEQLQAAGLLEEAIGNFPDDPRVNDMLFLAGSARRQAGDNTGALSLLRRALDGSPTADILPAVKLSLAQAYRWHGEPDQMAEVLKHFETEHPGHPMLPRVLFLLGLAHHDMNDPGVAEMHYRRLIELHPNTRAALEAHFELGGVVADLGKRDEAIQLYERFAKLNPNSPVAAKALERAGDLTLFRDPKRSAQFYALAGVKAAANPRPPIADLAIGRWFTLKRTMAGLVSRTWVLVILVIAALSGLGGLVLLVRRLVRRRRTPERARA
jgi:tetratricopeptide (TPR) repeat protein